MGRSGTDASATTRPRIASTSVSETSPAATFDSESWITIRPDAASGAARTARISVISRPRSATVRTRYMTASTRPHARLQPMARQAIARMSSRPDSVTDTAPTNVSAMNRPNSISDTRSTGLSSGSRFAGEGRDSTLTSVPRIAWKGAGGTRVTRTDHLLRNDAVAARRARKQVRSARVRTVPLRT